jgi:hypothetical protein
LKIEDEIAELMDKAKSFLPDDLKYTRNNGQSSYKEFDERIDKLKSIVHWIEKMDEDKEKAEMDEKNLETLRQLYQLWMILKRFTMGYLIRHKINKECMSPYIYVMAPYNYCFGCKIWKFDNEMTQKCFYDPLVCKKCSSEIYHLNNRLYLKFDPKKKMVPVLTLITDKTELHKERPTGEDFVKDRVIQIGSVIKSLLDTLDNDPNWRFPKDIKVEDLNIKKPEEFQEKAEEDDVFETPPVDAPPPIPVEPSTVVVEDYDSDEDFEDKLVPDDWEEAYTQNTIP